MDDTKNCVILKRKEYDELVKLANSKKPNTLTIRIQEVFDIYDPEPVTGTLDLSFNLYRQVRRVITSLENKWDRKLSKELKNNRESYLRDIEELKAEIANMSRSERRKYLKQYKTK